MDVARLEGVARERVEALGRRAQRIVAQGLGLIARRIAALLEEALQQCAALRGQHAALHLRAVVEPGFGKEVEY